VVRRSRSSSCAERSSTQGARDRKRARDTRGNENKIRPVTRPFTERDMRKKFEGGGMSPVIKSEYAASRGKLVEFIIPQGLECGGQKIHEWGG